VRLAGPGFGSPGPGGEAADAANQAAVDALRARGVDAAFVEPSGPPLHMKALIADGTLFLDDRNWPSDGRETILATDDPGAVAAVRSALAGEPPGTGGAAGPGEFATVKRRALALEARTLAAGSGDPPGGARADRVECESESFGPGEVCDALRRRAEAGAHVRLLVASRELGTPEVRALRGLLAAGVEVRLGERSEKIALAGGRAWVGSANATAAAPAMLDWGYATSAPDVVAALGVRFEEGWSVGRPFDAAALRDAAARPATGAADRVSVR
jgi:hypothetical protein